LDRLTLRSEENKLKGKKSSFDFVSIFACVIVSENVIGTMLIPVFDVQFSALGLGY
jgi:amino acid transporter